MMATKRDYYEVLGVSKTAQLDEIKRAYRQLAIKYHPDRNPDNKEAEDKFKEATEAYEILSDSQKRQAYDRFGHDGVSSRFGQGFNGAGFNFQDIFDSFGDMGLDDIFEGFFGGGGRRRSRANRSHRGSDLRYDMNIEFEEAVFGKKTEIEFPREETCKECNGLGASSPSKVQTCPTCEGSGRVVQTQLILSVAKVCPRCNGRGSIVTDPCKKCNGAGRVKKHRKIAVNIPPGVESGTRLRFSGQGEAGMNGGEPGDLYVIIHVRSHKFFERYGNDLYCELQIQFTQAALGANIQVNTLDKKEISVKVPEGTPSGHVFRIKNEGVPFLNGSGRGDLHVRVDIAVPKKLNSEQRKLLEEYAKLSGENVNFRSDIKSRLKNTFNIG